MVLENVIMDATIDYIVDKVIEKIVSKTKKGLLLFTGASIGYRQAINSINKLQKDGWIFDVVVSNEAQNVLTTDLLKKDLKIEKIFTEDDVSSIKELIDNNQIIIIPTLTVNSAAKISNCISDTIVTNIVYKGIFSSKHIVASINGCCPDNEERNSIYKGKIPNLYKETMRNNLEKLRSYNFDLTTSENLFNKVSKVHLKSLGIQNEINKVNSKDSIDKEESVISTSNNAQQKHEIRLDECIRINKKVISRSDIYINKDYKTIILNKNALITDLACEEAKKFNIKLLKE